MHQLIHLKNMECLCTLQGFEETGIKNAHLLSLRVFIPVEASVNNLFMHFDYHVMREIHGVQDSENVYNSV